MRNLRVAFREVNGKNEYRIEEELEKAGWIYSPNNPTEPRYFDTQEAAEQAIAARIEQDRLNKAWRPVENKKPE